ncbi:AAA family ATPase [Psychrobacter immobilis]|uniref:AAA family ATPase n=1 Tax=Psychrobacter immobilis TaxID=498 RepID=UPI001919F778|nr:AAA family ATPase [Psychrobacter immobilis]
MLGNDIQIKQLVGVGDVHLSFQADQRVYCLIGENGIGKTKCLEALFTLCFTTNGLLYANIMSDELSAFSNIISDNRTFNDTSNKDLMSFESHNLPAVMIGALNRGTVEYQEGSFDKNIWDYSARRSKHINNNFSALNNKEMQSLGMNELLNQWIIQRAQSANPYQAAEDNREIEITTLLNLLNKVDERIDSKFLEISGNNRVFIKVDSKKTELSELSSGFASLLKIMQSIIAGYSYFTNETNIAHVKGVVFIDEIENHLHTKWQATIIPTLKRLFPNTTFYITTHSAIVLSQLQHGEAYELYRDKEDGVVKTELIEHPNNAAFIDLLKDAFDIDINRLKLSRDNAPQQKNAKKMLSELLEKRINELREGTQ